MQKRTLTRRSILATLLTTLAVVSIVIALDIFLRQYTFMSVGEIRSIGVNCFVDSMCTIPVTSLNWGVLSPGDVIYRTIYVKNTGNVNMTTTMTTSFWSPIEAPTVMTITWNLERALLKPSEVRRGNLCLTLATDTKMIQSFTFLTIITGTETS